MTPPLPPYLKREKLISGLLMAFKRLLGKYTGIEKKRVEVQIRKMERYLVEIKTDPSLNYKTSIRFKNGVYYL